MTGLTLPQFDEVVGAHLTGRSLGDARRPVEEGGATTLLARASRSQSLRSFELPYRTGQFTTIGAVAIVSWPALAAARMAVAERSTRASAASFQVTMRTAHSGV